ncbi:MAG: hypothetical protein ACE366_14160 [Bradymonadia bacterium]
MGHFISQTDRMFNGVEYNNKTTEELRTAMTAKISALKEKITEREVRVDSLRREYNLDAERLSILIMRFKEKESFVSYESQGQRDGQTPVPAGVISNLISERQMIDSETSQIEKLELVVRNLCETEQFTVEYTGETKTRPCIHLLTDNELEYLGF